MTAMHAQERPEASASDCPKKQPVLLVEDDPEIQESLRLLLEDEGYDVVIASNGKEALEFLREDEREPCLILLDLMMPVLNGWELLQIIRHDDKLMTLPVTVVSGSLPAPETANRFMKKPVDLDELLAHVKELCG